MARYDILIVGAGAAGLTAALYAARRKLSTLVLSRDLGGQTATTMDIENYPGVTFSTGPDLMDQFAAQAKKFGAEIKLDGVANIVKTPDGFDLTGDSHTIYQARSIVLAFGKSHRHLDVPGEPEFMNKGVVYCATCDAPLFEGKPVAVIGGGNAAMDAVVLLSKIASKIYLVHRRDEFRAEAVMIDKVISDPKVELVLNSTVTAIQGDQFVQNLVINTPAGERILPVEGVFVEIGQTVSTEFLKGLIHLNDVGEIIIDHNNQTTAAGIFAAGDVTTVPFKQTVISAGEGAKAALAAYNYLQGRDPGAKFADQGYIK
ncbi:MAG: FAD-dependent oxidoreductase [Patescibacteria group bacterium]|jgi:thioredoxin-disulfide reductase